MRVDGLPYSNLDVVIAELALCFSAQLQCFLRQSGFFGSCTAVHSGFLETVHSCYL